jgi:Uncharacterised nucleotidyltransferase/Transglutaminase-like superfamily
MSIVDFLLGHDGTAPSQTEIQAYKLEGWTYAKLEPDHPVRKSLRPIVLARTAQQSLVRQHFACLLELWARAGLRPMVFKGFALSEFVYRHSYERSYGDIDVLFSLAEAKIAVDVARRAGWLESCHMDEEALGYDHEFSHLYTPDRTVRIDVHLELLQTDAFSSKRERLTRAIVDNAAEVNSQGHPLWIPRSVDHVIVFLLNRRWGDRWKRKPSDYTDLLALKENCTVTREAVLDRARKLGCERNITTTLETCDPWLKKLVINPPNRWQQMQWDLQCMSELGSYEIDYYLDRFKNASSRISYALRSLQLLFEATYARDRVSDLNALVGRFDAKPQSEARFGKLVKWCVGVRLANRILRWQKNPCVPNSLALLRMLSQAGFAASFVSGVRKVAGRLDGHAWVEVDGLPLEIMGDMNAPGVYKENFRYDNWLLRQRKAQAVKPLDDA